MAFSYLLKRALFELWTGVRVYVFAAICVFKEILIRICKKHLYKDDIQTKNKVAVITGGMSGTGLQTVHRLLTAGVHVIIGAPTDKEERLAFQSDMQNMHPNSKIEVWYLDLACLPSVKRFAERFSNSDLRLNILINNAGIMYRPYEETEDGFEYHFSVNYLGHALLTLLLLPRMIGTSRDCARVVNVASSVHEIGLINFEDMQGRKLYSRYFAYIQSKVCIVVFSYALQRCLDKHVPNITINALHPGVSDTNLYQHVGWATKYPILKRIFLMTLEEGCQTTVFASLSPSVEGIGGKYLQYCGISKSSPYTRREDVQNKLWKTTLKLLKPWLSEEIFAFLQENK